MGIRFSTPATVTAMIVMAGSLAACDEDAASTADSQSSQKDHPICENWDEDRYDDIQAQSEKYTGSTTLASGAYALNRCSTPPLDFTEVLRDETEKYVNASESDEVVLPTIYGEFFTGKGLYAAWSAMPRNEYDAPLDSEEAIAKAQQDFSEGLAAVTDPGNPVALGEDYINELRKLGAEEIPLRTYEENTEFGEQHQEAWEVHEEGETVYGWTILAPLLRHGEFHEDFLIPIATDMVEFDQQQGDSWNPDGEEPVSLDMTNPQAHTGMEAVLEALNRNHAAAEVVAEKTGDERVENIVENS